MSIAGTRVYVVTDHDQGYIDGPQVFADSGLAAEFIAGHNRRDELDLHEVVIANRIEIVKQKLVEVPKAYYYPGDHGSR